MRRKRAALRLSDLEPEIARRLKRPLLTLWDQCPVTSQQPLTRFGPEIAEAGENLKESGRGWNPNVLAFKILGGACIGGGLTVFWIINGFWVKAALTFLLYIGTQVWIMRPTPDKYCQAIFLSKIVRPLIPLVAQTPLERLYLDMVCHLLSQEEARSGNVAERRALLSSLNEFLTADRQVVTQQAQLQAILVGQDRTALETEEQRLRSLLESAKDPEARETLRQGMALSAVRREQTIALEPLQERLQAQREMITQAMAMLCASWNSRVAGIEQTVSVNAPSVARVRGQVRAVEQAVQEVVSLHRARIE